MIPNTRWNGKKFGERIREVERESEIPTAVKTYCRICTNANKGTEALTAGRQIQNATRVGDVANQGITLTMKRGTRNRG